MRGTRENVSCRWNAIHFAGFLNSFTSRELPAIDPLMSWSRYLDQLKDWLDENLGPEWHADVKRFTQLLHDGDVVYQMMQVTGYERYKKEIRELALSVRE